MWCFFWFYNDDFTCLNTSSGYNSFGFWLNVFDQCPIFIKAHHDFSGKTSNTHQTKYKTTERHIWILMTMIRHSSSSIECIRCISWLEKEITTNDRHVESSTKSVDGSCRWSLQHSNKLTHLSKSVFNATAYFQTLTNPTEYIEKNDQKYNHSDKIIILHDFFSNLKYYRRKIKISP